MAEMDILLTHDRLVVGSCEYGHENFRLHTITGIQIDEQKQTSQKGLPSM